jgi:glutathione synthase/RimK-type ligase-like ATP-grasp enzyme
MIKTNTFDVLVVYTESVAASASSKNSGSTPFSLAIDREHYSIAYAYFLNKCTKLNLKAAFTTSADIIGPGTCKSYWEYKNSKWRKVNQIGFAPIIFDKVSPLRTKLRKKRSMLFSKGISQPFNDKDLLVLFNDKLKTFKKLQNLTIPTVNITQKTVIGALSKLEKLASNHKNRNDFSDSFILKDRFGAGGTDIYKIGKNPIDEIAKILKASPKTSFVLQPFAKFDKGYSYKNLTGFVDIRIIYSQGKIIQRYIRTAKEKDFRCNEHQGGKVIYINAIDVPQSITSASNEIMKTLKCENALFALDFLVSNNGNAYFLEGNINPGIYWGLNSLEDKINTKKLINVIVAELKRRTENITFETKKKETLNIPSYISVLPILPILPVSVSKIPLVA